LFDADSLPTSLKNEDPWGIREIFDQYNLVFKLNQDFGYKFPHRVKKFLKKNDRFVNSTETRQRIDSTILQHLLLSAKTGTGQPKFIYAHFLKPHPPFFNDSLGKPLVEGTSDKEAYVQQVAFVNRTIDTITDSILSYTRRPLVIIIQGDHGYSYEKAKQPQMFSNFNAIYFSNKDYRLLNDSLTNVNTFRVVFNTFFGTEMKLLPDKFYYLLQ
ncbi:MAG TPA: sulfatase-like hydrolase/transferase, partial [Chitinophagaceae bacterium]|nr:sulfatase-like hydrolase/transferase [Chitinophagaceae bacterium]